MSLAIKSIFQVIRRYYSWLDHRPRDFERQRGKRWPTPRDRLNAAPLGRDPLQSGVGDIIMSQCQAVVISAIDLEQFAIDNALSIVNI